MDDSLVEKLTARTAGICLYGLAPPKQATLPQQLDGIVAQQLTRLRALALDGLIVYDIQDEGERVTAPRPFPFLPTLDPQAYADQHLAALPAPKIVYRCVSRDTPASFTQWLTQGFPATTPRIAVLVGAPSQRSAAGLSLANAYALARQHAPELLLGGVGIAERHAKSANEHERLLAKAEQGCRFFVTQAVYDVTATKSLLFDYAQLFREKAVAPPPLILTFSPCGSAATLSFMKWLGVAFPRWLEGELRCSQDALATSLTLCEQIFAELWDYAHDKGIALGVNVESVSIRKVEIDASVELFERLRHKIKGDPRNSPIPGEQNRKCGADRKNRLE